MFIFFCFLDMIKFEPYKKFNCNFNKDFCGFSVYPSYLPFKWDIRRFLANQLDRLADLIADQGEIFLKDVGIEFPARAVSAMLLIGERGGASAADIADALNQPHQVITQRIELLIEIGVISRSPDPKDRRRKILKLTRKGHKQFRALQDRLAIARDVFSALFDEINADLSIYAERAHRALTTTSLSERADKISGKKRDARPPQQSGV